MRLGLRLVRAGRDVTHRLRSMDFDDMWQCLWVSCFHLLKYHEEGD